MNMSILKQCARWAVAAAAVGLGLVSGAAHANRVSWSVGVNVPGPVYMAPQPVYVAPPQPVYYAPPAPMYAPPPAVVYRPAPMYRPAPVYYEQPRGYYRHHHHRGDRGDRGRGYYRY